MIFQASKPIPYEVFISSALLNELRQGEVNWFRSCGSRPGNISYDLQYFSVYTLCFEAMSHEAKGWNFFGLLLIAAKLCSAEQCIQKKPPTMPA